MSKGNSKGNGGDRVMRKIRVENVTVNMSVGEGGERLDKAENLLEQLTGQKPVRRESKKTIKPFNIRKGLPIACKVTLRGRRAEEFLDRALEAQDRKVRAKSFDSRGNFSFGIREHIDLPGVKYDPNVGIFGMDVNVTVERPGYRVKRRALKKSSVGKNHLITREESMKFIAEKYNVSVEE